jgi:hypothetical protein
MDPDSCAERQDSPVQEPAGEPAPDVADQAECLSQVSADIHDYHIHSATQVALPLLIEYAKKIRDPDFADKLRSTLLVFIREDVRREDRIRQLQQVFNEVKERTGKLAE